MNVLARVCPLCGTVLSAAKFARVMQAHRGIERELAKLRVAQVRATEQLQKARDQARAAAAREKAKATSRVADERRRAEDRQHKYQVATGKLRDKIGDLERRLKHGETAQSEGLLEERVLVAFLRGQFKNDHFQHVGKGGDILHDVCTDRGAKVGRIVYEVKRVTTWSSSHVRQCAEACVKREADLAILVTNRFPARKQHYFVERGVLVISPVALVPLVHTAREGLLNVHALRVTGDKKKRAVQAVYDYLAAGQYAEHIRRVAQHFTDLELLFHKEVDTHRKVWEGRLTHYRGILGGVATIHDRIRSLLAPVDQSATLPANARTLLPHFASTTTRTRSLS